MIQIPYNKTMTTDGYTPHKFMGGFIDAGIWTKLRSDWPVASLFKEEGHIKPRKHGQRPHLRMFMCYAPYPDSDYFEPYKIDKSKLPEIWERFVDFILTDKSYTDFLKETLQIDKFKIRLDWHLTKWGQDVSPHVDSAGKYGSHLMYFMPHKWDNNCGGQTIFYKGKLVDKMNPEPEDFAQNVTYPNMGNVSLLFKNSENGWHGVTKVNTDLNRQIFNVVILKND